MFKYLILKNCNATIYDVSKQAFLDSVDSRLINLHRDPWINT